MQPGINSSPMHPHCHCSTAPFIDREKQDKISENSVQNSYESGIIDYKEADSSIINKYDEKAFNLFGYNGDGDGILSEEEVKVLKRYTGNEFSNFNRYLRGEVQGINIFDKYYKDFYNVGYTAEKMKNILSNVFLDDNLILHRGLSELEFNKFKESNTFKNFVSTSFSKDIADEFAKDSLENNPSNELYYLNIKTPKGTQGVYIDGKGAYSNEMEFIINVGQKYKILEIKENTLYLEVVNEL